MSVTLETATEAQLAQALISLNAETVIIARGKPRSNIARDSAQTQTKIYGTFDNMAWARGFIMECLDDMKVARVQGGRAL